jgi:hypothetical protein
VLAVGIIAVLGSASIYVSLLVIAMSDRLLYLQLSNDMHTYLSEYGSENASTLETTAGPSVVIFLIGWLLIAIADISRRRPQRVSAGVLVIISAISFLLWLALVPLQFALGVLPGDPSFDGVRTLTIAPAIIFGLGAISPIGWLVARRIRSPQES